MNLFQKYTQIICNEIQEIYSLGLHTRPKPWPIQKPTVIQFPVNDICNARCQMCHIWQQKQEHQITPEALRAVLSNALFSEVRSIGVNGGEPTLRKDLPDLVDVMFDVLPKLRAVNIITNGLKSDVVIARLAEVGKIVRYHGGLLDVMLSLDGVGEVHDRVRGRPGNFDNAVKVLDFIQSSDIFSSERLGCTIIRENVFGMHDLLEFALKRDVYLKYRVGIPHQRLYTAHITDPFALRYAERYHVAVFLENIISHYETSWQQQDFYRSLIDQLMYNRPRSAGCDWQYRGVTLSSRGELLYCAVASKTLGSAINADARQIYYANQEHLYAIVENRCNDCLHDYVGLPQITKKKAVQIYIKRWSGRLKRRLPAFIHRNNALVSNVRTFVRPLRTYNHYLQRLNRLQLSHDLPEGLKPAKRLLNPQADCYKVLICGWYGTETLGDKAILGGIIHVLRATFAKIELHIASLEVFISRMTAEQMPELQGCFIHPIESIQQHVQSMDLVIFGGGPLMSPIAHLVDMRAIFQRAAEAKIPTIIAGCGVGPIHPASPYTRSIRHILELSSVRIFRDQKSLTTVGHLGIAPSCDHVAEDPAFTWLQNQILLDTTLSGETGNQPNLLLGLRDWPYQQYSTGLSYSEAQQIQERFEQKIIDALYRLLSIYPNLIITPFPMCTNHIGCDDRWFYRRLFRGHDTIYRALNLAYLEGECSPQAAIKAFQSASATLVMRYHALIFSLALGLPTVSIDYTLGQGKTKALADTYNVPHKSIKEIESEFIVDNISKYLGRSQQKSLFCFEDLTFSVVFYKALRALQGNEDK